MSTILKRSQFNYAISDNLALIPRPLTQDTLSRPGLNQVISKPPMAPGRKIIIADSNPVVRAGLNDFISKDLRFQVVDVVEGGNAFLAACEGANPVEIGIAAWTLADMNGGDLLAAVKRRDIKTRVIIYTSDNNPNVLRAAVKAGAWGFVLKSDNPELLLETVSFVARGRLCLPYIDIEALSQDPLEALTSRERQLLTALSNGLTNEQIAARIGISRNTVKYHLKNVYDKLGVKNRAMAVALFAAIPQADSSL